jgi:hypothetical protein
MNAPRILKAKLLLKVVQPPISVNPPKVIHIGKKLQGMLFSNKGESKIEVKLDKSQYHPGETVHITCDVDNSESEKSIWQIKFRFYKCVRGIDQNRGRRIKRQYLIFKHIHDKIIKKGESTRIEINMPLKIRKIVNNTVDNGNKEE